MNYGNLPCFRECGFGALCVSSLVPQIAAALDDVKDLVRFTAAACVAHLSELPVKESPAEPAKP